MILSPIGLRCGIAVYIVTSLTSINNSQPYDVPTDHLSNLFQSQVPKQSIARSSPIPPGFLVNPLWFTGDLEIPPLIAHADRHIVGSFFRMH